MTTTATTTTTLQAHHSSLQRTFSATSISSDDTTVSTISTDTTAATTTSRRTRRRFNSAQLAMLEQLYHQNSHPTRVERDALAKAGGMESRSVTIWFQNKRQTERRVALHNATNNHSSISSSNKTKPSSSSTVRRRASSPFTSSTTSSTSSRSSRPSLDRVASRSELWAPPPPQTPTRPTRPRYAFNPNADDSNPNNRDQNENKNIWDNMPSSPIAPPFSPPARDYVEFGRAQHKRTLEWACAAARLAEKDGLRHYREEEENLRNGEDTDEEVHEAVTPPSTLGAGDRRWGGAKNAKVKNVGVTVIEAPVKVKKQEDEQDDDMMRAALALCGLGRRC